MPNKSKSSKKTLTDSALCKVYKFTEHKKVFFIISAVLILISLASTFTGVDMDIEFKGGSIITYSYENNVDEKEVMSIVSEIADGTVTVQAGEDLSTGGNSLTVSISSKDGISDDQQSEITSRLQEKYPDGNIKIIDSNSVNASNGRDFFLKCIIAVVFAAIILILYIAIRFRVISGWSAGVFAIAALLHDIIITYGAFVLMRFEIDANFMAVILTIFGYSVNDTIVVYDRIRENQKLYPTASLEELVNVSNSQTFRRSLRTSITTVGCMVVISVVAGIMGITSILSFSLPLCIGLAVGTYSSICFAPNLWVWWKGVRKNKALSAAKK